MKKHIKVSSSKFRLLNLLLQMDPDLIDLEHFEPEQDGNRVHEAINPKTGFKYDVVSLPRSFLLSHLEEFSNYFNRMAMLESRSVS
jgi:hypothetical protein